jgi:hypothetical protein
MEPTTRDRGARCPVCGAAIIWAYTQSDRRLAVDPEPLHRLGSWSWCVVELYSEVFPCGEPVDGVQRVRSRPADRPATSPAWSLHWASCHVSPWGHSAS